MTVVDRSCRNRIGDVDLITVPEAAKRIGLHADTLYRLCRAGQFPPAVQIGSRWRVSVPRLKRYLHADAESSPGSTPPSKAGSAR
jgi:excisionase family DNA binding protein